jgi:hypothetical protein
MVLNVSGQIRKSQLKEAAWAANIGIAEVEKRIGEDGKEYPARSMASTAPALSLAPSELTLQLPIVPHPIH